MDRQLHEYANELGVSDQKSESDGDSFHLDEIVFALSDGDITKSRAIWDTPVSDILKWGLLSRKREQRWKKERQKKEVEDHARNM
jgi:hypothetical protein